jgi:DNA-binding NarL/FixJ family response regulator
VICLTLKTSALAINPRFGLVKTNRMPDLYRTRTLTANERLIIALVAEGLENKDIAGQIGRSTRHTNRTLQTIFDTTGCCTR